MAQALAARGILIRPTSERQIRAVTHHPISRRQIERAVDGFKDVRFSA
jgi:threonine aldolase